jgi:GT2 family glycosyltransferase
MSEAGALLSVIVPAHQASSDLEHCLRAIEASDLSRSQWELIVVDDGSTDDTAQIASRHADSVVELPGKPRGPSYARNRGAEVARCKWLVFVDADVCVHRDTLRGFKEVIEREPDVAAFFGSYDADPPARGLPSKYRNLLHHYVHQRNAGEAETFWAGCGAIRRDVFWNVGMFDEWHFWRPQVEDIELGRRIRRAGHRILLVPEIQGRHLKRWTLRNILAADFKHRGVPWTRLIMTEGASPGSRTLNLRPIEKWLTVVTGIGALALLFAAIFRTPWPLLISLAAVAFVVRAHLDFYRLLRRQCGFHIAIGSIPLQMVYYLGNAASSVWGWLTHTFVGPPVPPPDVAAFEELDVDSWPPIPKRPEKSVWGADGH